MVTAVALLAALIVATAVGALDIRPADIIRELTGSSVLNTQQHAVLLNVRLPRIATAVVVGAMLASSGATYQAVFRNPLADPYLLGVSAGAGLGVTCVIVFGAGLVGIIPAAFVGGVLAVLATYVVAGSRGDATTVILAGVAVAAFASAAQTYIQQSNIDHVQRIFSWMLGSLNVSKWSTVATVALPVAVCLLVLACAHRQLDVIALGDAEAAALGANPRLIRGVLIATATLGTACVVAISGLIGFVGIVVPHALRLVVGPAHHLLMPLTIVWGAIFMLFADTAARTVLAPSELPVGVVTAVIGAPFFLILLRRYRREALC
ncbi:iron ABC transporter permease [Corynebacterium diphtheriae]|nr:iron ABC transporter permease [Corynebacterium diphtheriae]